MSYQKAYNAKPESSYEGNSPGEPRRTDSVSKPPTQPHRSQLEMQLLFTFMALVLVLLGVLIDKISTSQSIFGWNGLEQRYRTFKDIDDLPSTYWDIHRHKGVASNEVWKSIIKRNTFASAYYHREEPEFSQLDSVFGPRVTKSQHNSSVIVISESTCPVSEAWCE
ncbi:hypothetical protein SASPL_130432 [Salvia splendens]|uniref:Uncharacterized protein n=1 Tax=Salvia splendens TaxID=180675 RepID=A0A8X8ZJX0_SALSN|nr:hypothetical protein SASPL_130432 [Salvia splendens]